MISEPLVHFWYIPFDILYLENANLVCCGVLRLEKYHKRSP